MIRVKVSPSLYLGLLRQDAHDWTRGDRQIPSGSTSLLADMALFLAGWDAPAVVIAGGDK